MTESEALIELKLAYEAKGTGYGCISKDTLEMAIKALEKQIPKKPKIDNRYIMYICPYCNDFVKVSHNYCQNCGQKLDWSEEE